MIRKKRHVPLQKERLEVLLRRLPTEHPGYEEVVRNYGAVCAGIAGEERFDEFLEKSERAFPHIVLHDLHLLEAGWFQIDSLMITPWCMYIFEVKNIAGRLRFESNPGQLIRTTAEGQVEGLSNPADQLETIEWQLTNWLSRRGYFLPIRSMLVISHAKQVVEQAPNGLMTIFSYQLPAVFRKLNAEPAKVNSQEMEKLSDELLAAHQPYRPKPICTDGRYAIQVMRKGVWCETCGRIGMERRYGKWLCPACGKVSVDAHERTLRDWVLLTGGPLTNKVCREVLQVDNRQLVTRILKRFRSGKSGSFRDAAYRIELF